MSDDTANLSLGRETFIGFAAKIVLAVTGFAGVIIFSRVLGVEGVGKYYFILAAAKLAVQVPSGVSGAIKKRVSEVNSDAAEFFGLGFLFNIGFTALISVALLVTYPLTEQYFGPPVFVLGLGTIVGSLALFGLTNKVYAGIGYPGASFWIDTVRSVITLALQVGFLVVGFRVLGLITGLVAATVVSTVLSLLAAKLRPKFPSRETVVRTYQFARWNVPNALTMNFYSRLDVLLLYVLVGSTATGLYEPALRLTIAASFIASSIGDSLTVKASGLDSLGEDVEADLRNSLSYTSLFAIPLFFGALAMPEQLMGTVYGPDFRDGAAALVGLALFQLFNTYRMPIDSVFLGIDRPELIFRVNTATFFINLPLAILFGIEYGLVGVVAATIIAEAARVAFDLYLGYQVFGSVLVTRPLFEQFAAGAAMFVAVEWLFLSTVNITGWIPLIGIVGAGAVVYFALLLAISPHFRLTIGNVLTDVRVAQS